MYYLRDRKGKSARISEKIKKRIGVDVSEQTIENEILEEEPKKVTSATEVKNEDPKKTELKKENITKDKDVVLKTESKKEKLKTEKK